MSKSDKAKIRGKKRQAKQQQKLKQKRARPSGSGATCKVCGRPATPEPADPLLAAQGRLDMVAANGPERGDLFAYMFAKSTVLVTASNQDKLCECDLRNWAAAGKEYEALGAAQCWASLGVTDHVMRQAEAQTLMQRLEEGQTLSEEDKQRMVELEAYFHQHEVRGGTGGFAHRPKSPPRDPSRKRAERVQSSDADPLFPYEEYIEAKYQGEHPNDIAECLRALEELGLEKAAEATGRSQSWLEGWGKLYGAEHVLQDIDFSDPFRRALLELSKLHPEDFRDLWEDEEKAQPELEATPIGRQNAIVSGFPFVRGRVDTTRLASDRETSRQIRPVRAVRPLRVVK